MKHLGVRNLACLVKGKMGSDRRLARRVVETETPVMVQVLNFESPCAYGTDGYLFLLFLSVSLLISCLLFSQDCVGVNVSILLFEEKNTECFVNCLLCLWVERLDEKSGIVGLCLQIQELIRGAGDAMSLAQVCFHYQLSFQLSQFCVRK